MSRWAHTGIDGVGLGWTTFTFWGAWLLPLAVLVWRSKFLPRFLGAWLAINGIAYLVLRGTGLLAPPLEGTVSMLAFPAQLGEIALMVGLLLGGRRLQALQRT